MLMRRYIVLLLMFFSQDSAALNLFGVAIENIERDVLRNAIRDSGADVIREAGEENWYDIYDLSGNFPQAKRLYVAYDKASSTFAFAEYHLPYTFFNRMHLKLKNKYGDAEVRYGLYESDKHFVWQVDGIEIKLQQNWEKNVSELVYRHIQKTDLVAQAYWKEKLDKYTAKLQESIDYY